MNNSRQALRYALCAAAIFAADLPDARQAQIKITYADHTPSTSLDRSNYNNILFSRATQNSTDS